MLEEFNSKSEELLELRNINVAFQQKLNEYEEKCKNYSDVENYRDRYEELLRKYSETMEEIEKDLKFQEKCEILEDKTTELEAEIIIEKSRAQKYKKILYESRLLDPTISSPSEQSIEKEVSHEKSLIENDS